MDIFAGIVLDSLSILNAENRREISGSFAETINPGVQEDGEVRSPRAKIRANRPLAATLRASGRSSAPSAIKASNDAVRLKDSNGEAGPEGREPDRKCHFRTFHIPYWRSISCNRSG